MPKNRKSRQAFTLPLVQHKSFHIVLQFCCGFTLLASIASCTGAGHRQASPSIDKARENGVFVSEYVARSYPYQITDSLSLHWKSIWLERQWTYSQGGDVRPYEPPVYQLCLKTEPADLTGYYESWSIGTSPEMYLRMSNRDALISDFRSVPNDTLIYWVQRDQHLGPNQSHDTIGTVVLVKLK